MDNEVLASLQAPFKLKARQGQGGRTFYYVSADDVVERMNSVFKGNWSTEIIKLFKEEDYIIAHVRVAVYPGNEVSVLYHDGVASQLIARYTSGFKKDQPIDLGNSYKAAISKAIKVACSRFGVGLKLDPDTSSQDIDIPGDNQEMFGSPMLDVPDNTISIPPVNQPELNTTVPPIDITAPVVESNKADQVAVPPVDPPVNFDAPRQPDNDTKKQNPPIIDESGIPDFPINSEDVKGTADKLPDIPENVVKDFVPNSTEQTPLTPVQKTAITILMDQYGLTYKDLMLKALGTDKFPELDQLSYKDAVKVLQYGNKLK